MTMKVLIEKIKSGDEAAFQTLIDETKSKAFYTAKGIVKNDQDAEEVVNSAYFQMYQKIDTLKNAEKFNSWFSKIVVNLSLNKLRQGQNKEFVFSQFDSDEYREDYLESIEDDNINNNPQQAAISSELSQKISAAMENLTEKQRQCLQYYYFNDLSVGEIAELFDVPKSTVKTRLRLGRENLKSRLEKENIFGLSFLPAFFNSQITACEMNIVASEIMKSSAVIAISAAQGAGAVAAEAGGEAVASAVVTTVAKGSIVKKVIAGIVALSVVAAGTGVAVKAVVGRTDDETTTAVTEDITEPETTNQEYVLTDEMENSTSETEAQTEAVPANTIKSETEAAVVKEVEGTTEAENDSKTTTKTTTTTEKTTLAVVTYSYDSNIPGTLAVKNSGNTYYSDIGKRRIVKKTSSGKESTALKNVKVYQMLSYKGYIYYADESKKAIYQWNLSTGKKTCISKKKLVAQSGSLSDSACLDIYIKGDKLVYIANDKGTVSASNTAVYAYDLKTGKTTTVTKASSGNKAYLNYTGVYKLYNSSGKSTVYDINGTVVKSASGSVIFENDDYQITSSGSYKYKIKNKSTGKTYSNSYLKKEFKKLVKSYGGWSVEESDTWSSSSSVEIYSLAVAGNTAYAHIHVVNSSLNVYDDVTLSLDLA